MRGTGMPRLAAIVSSAALAGGLAGAGLELAIGGAGRAASAPSPAAAAPAPAPVPEAGPSPEAIYRQDAPGVVVVTATEEVRVPTLFGPSAEQQVRSLGSGFVIDAKGDIVTNQHVVGDATDVRVGFSGGATYPAKVLGTDPSTDLAVLRVEAPASVLHPLRFADSSRVEAGDSVYAIGNPFGLERTMTSGIVSATGRDIAAPNGLGIPNAIQTDAPINHGNSGGPLLDSDGRVIGVNDQIESGGAVDANVGVGFAVPSSSAASVVRQLVETGHVEHAYLGVQVATVSPEITRVVKGLPAHGALVVAVVPGGPAAEAGLRAGQKQMVVNGQTVLVGGDTIVSADGRPVRSAAQLADAVRSYKPGDRIALEVVGPKGKRTVTAILGNAPGAR